jgi:hypothetical protein
MVGEIAHSRNETASLDSSPQDHSHSVADFRPSCLLFAEGWERARKLATCWLC